MVLAAKPMLGQVGFTVMTIAALISTFSAINASLYGGSRVSNEIAEDDELPHALTSQLWNQPIGLIITEALTLVLVNTLDLESISTSGSVGFLLIFALVNYSAYKLSNKVNAKKSITFAGFLLCLVASIVLVIQQFSANETGVIVSLSIILACFLMEFIYKKTKKEKS